MVILLTIISKVGHSLANPKHPVLFLGNPSVPIPSAWLFEILAHLSLLSAVMWAEEQIGNRFKDQAHAIWENLDPTKIHLIQLCHWISGFTIVAALVVLSADAGISDADPRSWWVHAGLLATAILVVIQRMLTWTFHLPYKSTFSEVAIIPHPAGGFRAKGFSNIEPEA